MERAGEVLSFELTTGAFTQAYPFPSEFRASTGTPIALSADRTRLFLPGLWPEDRGSFDREPASRMYVNSNLGLELSLATGSSKSIAVALERGCRANSSACLRVDMQPLHQGEQWVVGQGGGSRIGFLSRTGGLVRAIDVRSPEFYGDESWSGRSAEAQMKWGETNSSLWGVYALRDVIAVIHARHATRDWRRGQLVQFLVFMNLYSPTGERLVSDIRLPDLPVGHDDTHVLVIDYGPEGRRSNAGEVRLLKIPARAGTAGFASTS